MYLDDLLDAARGQGARGAAVARVVDDGPVAGQHPPGLGHGRRRLRRRVPLRTDGVVVVVAVVGQVPDVDVGVVGTGDGQPVGLSGEAAAFHRLGVEVARLAQFQAASINVERVCGTKIDPSMVIGCLSCVGPLAPKTTG